MAECMTQEQIDWQVRVNKGTAKTNNDIFEKQGYLVIRDLIDPKELYCEVPNIRGQINYYGKLEKFSHTPVEMQVEGSLARYYYPPYKESYFKVKKRLENIVGKPLSTTYYYDRYYFPSMELKKHADRDACEISVSIHIGSNLKDKWGFKLIDVEGNEKELFLNPGDGLLYKGCELCHWRDPMPGKRRNKIRKWLGMEEYYYHQIFMHFVLRDGLRVHCANDMSRN